MHSFISVEKCLYLKIQHEHQETSCLALKPFCKFFIPNSFSQSFPARFRTFSGALSLFLLLSQRTEESLHPINMEMIFILFHCDTVNHLKDPKLFIMFSNIEPKNSIEQFDFYLQSVYNLVFMLTAIT